MNWISCEDRLPKEIIEFVLVSRNKGVACVVEAHYVNGKFMSYRFGMIQEFKEPTHWMPLPEPPE